VTRPELSDLVRQRLLASDHADLAGALVDCLRAGPGLGERKEERWPCEVLAAALSQPRPGRDEERAKDGLFSLLLLAPVFEGADRGVAALTEARGVVELTEARGVLVDEVSISAGRGREAVLTRLGEHCGAACSPAPQRSSRASDPKALQGAGLVSLEARGLVITEPKTPLTFSEIFSAKLASPGGQPLPGGNTRSKSL